MIFTNNIENALKKDINKIYFLTIPFTYYKNITSTKIENLNIGFNINNYNIKTNLKITIVKNPFDLLCSYYLYNKELNIESNFKYNSFIHNFKSFDEFIDSFINEKHTNFFITKFLFKELFDEKDDCSCDIIIKYEFIDVAIKVLNMYGFDIHQLNNQYVINQQKNYKDYYNDELIEKVNRKCCRELEIFKYNFNGSVDNNPFIINPSIKYNIKKDELYYLVKN